MLKLLPDTLSILSISISRLSCPQRYLPRDCDEEEATKLFSPCGKLAKPISVLKDFATGLPKGACFVTFESSAGAAAALKMNGRPIRGRHLEITMAVSRYVSQGYLEHKHMCCWLGL